MNRRHTTEELQRLLSAHVPGSAWTPDPATAARLQPLAELMDGELDADRQWFKRRPNRTHRLRRAFAMEARFHKAMDTAQKGVADPLWELQPLVAVKQVEPGIRVRLFFFYPDSVDTRGIPKSPERESEALFETVLCTLGVGALTGQ